MARPHRQQLFHQNSDRTDERNAGLAVPEWRRSSLTTTLYLTECLATDRSFAVSALKATSVPGFHADESMQKQPDAKETMYE